MYIYIYVYIHTYLYICIYVCVYIYMYIYVYSKIHLVLSFVGINENSYFLFDPIFIRFLDMPMFF